MQNLTLKQLQQTELEVLVEIDRVCTELGLTYYLAYGTLLGAVRHKGFIPWDDDVDIWMPRIDMDVLVEKFSSIASNNFKVFTHHDKGYRYPFPKVVNLKTEVVEKGFKKMPGFGAWVDVFPLDYVAEDHAKEDEQLISLEHKRLMSLYSESTFFTKIRWIYGTFIYKDVSKKDFHGDTEAILDEFIKLSSKHSSGKELRVCFNESGLKTVYPCSWFLETKRMKFEGHQLVVPAQAHEILSHLYGDYMTPPPLKDRIAGHHFRSSRFVDEEK